MAKLPLDKIHELVVDVLSRCTTKLLLESDEEIEHQLFEYVGAWAPSFLHAKCLEKLVQANLMSELFSSHCQQIHEKWMELAARDWSASEVRESQEWRAFFESVDVALALA